MNITNISKSLDLFYSQGKSEDAYQLLLDSLQKAMVINRDDIVLFLLSELMGYYRVTSQFDLGNKMATQSLKIISNHKIENTIEAATVYLNIATLYRVQGRYTDSLNMYILCEKIYQNFLNEDDERYASFYNNISLLFQEMGDFKKAIEYEFKALNIIKELDNCEIEEAITYTNLSSMYKNINNDDKSLNYLKKALFLFEKHGKQDPHYFAALSLKAQYYYSKKQYNESIELYKKILNGLEKVYGKSKEYYIVQENMNRVLQEYNHSIKGIDLCFQYYKYYGKNMIEQFSEYLPYIAVGLFGYGSDCLGYDDNISIDHDYGPGFVVLLPKDIYMIIGEKMQKAYQSLPNEFMGYKRITSKHGNKRVGVYSIEDYFSTLINKIPQSKEDWLYSDENALLLCTNGKIFEDNYGEVTKIRKYLEYYPEDIKIQKLAKSIALLSQSGQYNYARCMKRNDEVAAGLALYQFIDEVISCIYLLNKKYKPYYKWSYRGLDDCTILKDLKSLLKELILLPSQKDAWTKDVQDINYNDKKVIIIEKICQRILSELKKQKLTKLDDDFLGNHVAQIITSGGIK